MKNLFSNKRAAMEMSIGTIVTIVLLMSVLILGIFLVQKVFNSGSNAIDSIDNQVQSEIEKLFAEDGKKLAVYPTSRQVTLKKGDDPKGFAFSVRNDDVESATFSYSVESTDITKCGSTLTQAKANDYLLGGSGQFSLGPGNSLDLPRIVRFDLPETAPPCNMIYYLQISKNEQPYSGADIFITIQ